MITGLIALGARGSQRVARFHVPSAVIHQLAAPSRARDLGLLIAPLRSRAEYQVVAKSQQRRRCLFMLFIDLFMYLLYIS